MTVTHTLHMNYSLLELLLGQVDRELKVKEANMQTAQWRSALLQPIVCSNDATSTDNISCDTGERHMLWTEC
jgi:hypothetical protein